MMVKTLHVDLYKVDIVLFVGGGSKGIRQWCKEKKVDVSFLVGLDDIDKRVQGRQWEMPGGGSIILIPKYQHGYLVHELEHAVQHLMASKGIPLTEHTREVYAYALEYCFGELCLKKR